MLGNKEALQDRLLSELSHQKPPKDTAEHKLWKKQGLQPTESQNTQKKIKEKQESQKNKGKNKAGDEGNKLKKICSASLEFGSAF